MGSTSQRCTTKVVVQDYKQNQYCAAAAPSIQSALTCRGHRFQGVPRLRSHPFDAQLIFANDCQSLTEADGLSSVSAVVGALSNHRTQCDSPRGGARLKLALGQASSRLLHITGDTGSASRRRIKHKWGIRGKRRR